jgi:hypothetical protein
MLCQAETIRTVVIVFSIVILSVFRFRNIAVGFLLVPQLASLFSYPLSCYTCVSVELCISVLAMKWKGVKNLVGKKSLSVDFASAGYKYRVIC